MKAKNDTVTLGHYFANDSILRADTTIILKNGKGVFKGNKKLAIGLYFIFNNKRKVFDFLIGDNQKFSISVDTTNIINKLRFTFSPDNDVFYDFIRYDIQYRAKSQQLQEQYNKTTDATEKNTIREQSQIQYKERMAYIQKLADENRDLYVGKFLNALIPIDSHLPEPPKDAEGRITDSTYVFRWYCAHFFDNLNISDSEMLRTPFFGNKVMEYMRIFQYYHPDTICVQIDNILTKVQGNDEIFRYVLPNLLNHYITSKLMAHENVWVHIADKWYIPYATWGSAEYIETLKKEVAQRKASLIGKQTPPLEMLMVLPPGHFKAAALDTAIKNDLQAGVMLQDFRKNIKSKFTVLFFWDYSCGHCKESIRKLYQVYEDYKDKGLQVIAVQVVNTKEAKAATIDFINENDMLGWINAWSPFHNKWRDLYHAPAWPTIYLLDENMTIHGKNLAPEQVKDFIDPVKRK